MLAELDERFGRDGLTWSGGEALRAVGAKLRDFRGIASCVPPDGFEGELRGYQRHGLDWLQFLREHGLSGVLADDMGLGKTIQVLAHILEEKSGGTTDLPSLVVAPDEPDAQLAAGGGAFRSRPPRSRAAGSRAQAALGRLPEHDIVLTTYPLLRRDEEVLTAQEFHLLILDEAQFLKNAKAQASEIARRLRARHRLGLTGTPMENHLGELWSIFDLLMPGLLGDERAFRKLFRTPIEKYASWRGASSSPRASVRFSCAAPRTRSRRSFPPRPKPCRWSSSRRHSATSTRASASPCTRRSSRRWAAKGVARSTIIILDALLKLRQVCCDPALLKFKGAERRPRVGQTHGGDGACSPR